VSAGLIEISYVLAVFQATPGQTSVSGADTRRSWRSPTALARGTRRDYVGSDADRVAPDKAGTSTVMRSPMRRRDAQERPNRTRTCQTRARPLYVRWDKDHWLNVAAALNLIAGARGVDRSQARTYLMEACASDSVQSRYVVSLASQDVTYLNRRAPTWGDLLGDKGHSKDYEFSRLSVEEHWHAGYQTRAARCGTPRR
jgi:hypothetical protein